MEMRRKDRATDRTEAEAILAKGEYGILATIGEDGYPYGVPISYAVDQEKIYFHCAKASGHKNLNLEYSDKVCFTVVGATEVLPSEFATRYESVIVFGKAKVAEDKMRGLEKIVEKYSPDFKPEGKAYAERAFKAVELYEIQIEKITGKARK